jgi:hypothetical protein
MVKNRKKSITETGCGKEFFQKQERTRVVGASTEYETCSEHISPFGGLLALVKFFDLIRFREIFDSSYQRPARDPKLGHYLMLTGILMLLFIGFNRIWHFTYLRLDAMLCGIFRVTRLPSASTFWRYVDSLGINQANSLLRLMAVLRERVWRTCGIGYCRVRVNIDTTVETLFGNQQGGRKGHNTKNRGKKGYRPVLCFIANTREYLVGKLRRGETISGEESAEIIGKIAGHLPGCVMQVLLCADAEFLSWESVNAAMKAGFKFIIGNKGCRPVFDPSGWYRPYKRKPFEFNSCVYRPSGWGVECRFVVMRLPKEKKTVSGQPVQCPLFEDDQFTYRIFCTNEGGKPHKIIESYDQRADVENLIGEAKREGLDAIPSAKFKNNYAYFQIVMLAYNIWRYLKIMAERSREGDEEVPDSSSVGLTGIENNTIRIARLKVLLIAAKLVSHSNRDMVKFSEHDARTPGLMYFLKFLDKKRAIGRPWLENRFWQSKFSLNYG